LIAEKPSRCPTGVFQNNLNVEDGKGLCGCCSNTNERRDKDYRFKMFRTVKNAQIGAEFKDSQSAFAACGANEQCKGILQRKKGENWKLLVPGGKTFKDDKRSGFRVSTKVTRVAKNWRIIQVDFDLSMQETFTVKNDFTLMSPVDKKGRSFPTDLKKGTRGRVLYYVDERSLGVKRVWFDGIGEKKVAEVYWSKFDIVTPQAKGWALISATKACQKNNEGILNFAGGDKVKEAPDERNLMTLRACQEWCEGTDECKAIDFYHKGGVCLLYKKACKNPQATWAHASSYRMTSSPTTTASPSSTPSPANSWVVISETAACEKNLDGIKHTFASKGFTLESCKAHCTGSCVAIDFYRKSGWCLLYDTACSTPQRTVAGASSYRKEDIRRLGQIGGIGVYDDEASVTLV